jgi:DNA primase
MSFPPSFLDELRQRLPLSGIVGRRVRLLRAGREFKGCCPFHNEKSPSFYVNDDKQFYHCFGCGAHGDVIGFTMRMDNLSFPDAIESLAGQAGLPVPRDTPVQREAFDREKSLHQLLDRAASFFEEQLFAPAGREGLNYLRGRGLSDDAIRRFRLGYAPPDSQLLIRRLTGEGFKLADLVEVGLAKVKDPVMPAKAGIPAVEQQTQANGIPAFAGMTSSNTYSFFRQRVMFPVGDRRGRIVAFGGRVLGDGEPKYLNSPDHVLFHKGKLLYGLSRARGAAGQNQPIIVVEGYMDVIALVEAGFQGAVAPLGTALTEDQLGLLWRLLPPATARDPARDYSPILCFDGDKAGLRAAARAIDRALPLLTPAQSLRIAYLPEGQDPDDLIKQAGRSAMQTVLDQAKPMIDAVWDLTLAGRRLTTPEERGSFIAAIKQQVARIQDETLRQLYQDDVQKRLASTFEWQRPAAERQKWRGKPGFQPAFAAPLPRKAPTNAQALRERVLLATMLNYPALFEEFGENLAHLAFSTPDHEAVRQKIVAILSDSTEEDLDAAALYRHLCDGDDAKPLTRALTAIMSEATYMHAGFARPGRTAAEARHGWNAIWTKYLLDMLQADLQAAKQIYATDSSDANWTRLLHIRSQLESLTQDATDPEQSANQQISSL